MLRFGFAVLGILLSAGTLHAEQPTPPNVLFIAVDDLNDWIGCLDGHPQALTPNLDRLAKRGILFTNAHCVATACRPSRAAVFSGQWPADTRVWSNESRPLRRLNPDQLLLTDAFANAGYHTFGTGKLLGDRADLQTSFNAHQRWSPFTKEAVEYTSEELPSKGSDEPRHIVKADGGRSFQIPLNRMPSDRAPDRAGGESFDWGPIDVPDAEMGDTQITDWASDILTREMEQPFFLGVGYYRPHIPLWAPKKYFDRFLESNAELPPVLANDLDDLGATARRWALEPITAGSHQTVVEHDQWQAAVEAYLACITYVDFEVGRLLDALEETSSRDNTMIVLWSDHGWHLGEKEHWGKWTGWERSTRVPLIIVPPRNQAGKFAVGGTRCDQPVSLIDLFPTLMAACEIDTPDGLAGESLIPLLQNPTRETGRVVPTFFDPGNVSIRTERWRYIRYADGSNELYDHLHDPNEWHNLSAEPEFQDVKRSLHNAAKKYFEDH